MGDGRAEKMKTKAEDGDLRRFMAGLLAAESEEDQLRAASEFRIQARARGSLAEDSVDPKQIGEQLPKMPVRVRREVMAGLGEIGHESFIPVLAEALEVEDLRVQAAAVDALHKIGKIGKKEAVESLKAFSTGSKFEQVALLAAKAIQALQPAGSSTVVSEAATSSPTPIRERRSPVRDRSGWRSDDENVKVAQAARSALHNILSADVSERVREFVKDALETTNG